MKPLTRYLLLAGIVGLLAFGLTRWLSRPSMQEDEQVWLQKEFHLTAAQSAEIERLQAAYEPVCMDHCARVMKARKRIETLAAAGQVGSDDYHSAQTEMTRLKEVCRVATLAHLQSVAAVMSPEDGRRFLTMVVPKLSQQSHEMPLGLK